MAEDMASETSVRSRNINIYKSSRRRRKITTQPEGDEANIVDSRKCHLYSSYDTDRYKVFNSSDDDCWKNE